MSSQTETAMTDIERRRAYNRNYSRTRRPNQAEYHRQYRTRMLLDGKWRCEVCNRNCTTNQALQRHRNTAIHQRAAAMVEQRRQQAQPDIAEQELAAEAE